MRRVYAWARRSLVGEYAIHLYHWIRAVFLSPLSDEEFAQRSYRRFNGKSLNLRNPTTFDERQWWLKIHYRDPLMTVCTDKVAVRGYVEGVGLGHLLIPLLGVYRTPEEIEWDNLPRSFYLKANHSSATNIRCSDRATFDVGRATRLMKLYLKRDHYALSREWNYRGIDPKVMVEPIIRATGGHGLVDYRFVCSFGICKAIFLDMDTADSDGRHRGDAMRSVYDPEWNLLDVRVTRPMISGPSPNRPYDLEEMIRCAEILSGPFPFCRVDLYNPEPGRIIFGEVTFFHAGGNNSIYPEGYQLVMGEWIDFERVLREMPVVSKQDGSREGKGWLAG